MKNHYVPNESRSKQKPHNVTSDEVTEAFIKAGWLGKRRERKPWIRAVPFFDRGPGAQHEN